MYQINKTFLRKKEVNTMATNKMTKREHYDVLKGIVEKSDYPNKEDALAFIAHEVELLNKKHSKGTETKLQKENRGVKAEILEVLVELAKPVTVTELVVAMDNQYTNQKLSAMLKQMIVEGTVARSTEGKKSYFSAI